MSLETLANLGEFLAAIGMFVSVIYLGVQTRQNTLAVRGSAQQTWSQLSGDLLHDIYCDPELAELFQRVAFEEDDATQVDEFRFHMLMLRLIRNADGLAYLQERGLVDSDIWTAYLASTRKYLELPGFRGWIESNYELATPRMQNVLRRLAAEVAANSGARSEREQRRRASDVTRSVKLARALGVMRAM
jgi:hypothetical protein